VIILIQNYLQFFLERHILCQNELSNPSKLTQNEVFIGISNPVTVTSAGDNVFSPTETTQPLVKKRKRERANQLKLLSVFYYSASSTSFDRYPFSHHTLLYLTLFLLEFMQQKNPFFRFRYFSLLLLLPLQI